MADLIENITYVAEREDKLVHGVLELSKRMDHVSDKLTLVNRKIRSLDASVPHERTIKVIISEKGKINHFSQRFLASQKQ